MSYYLGDVVPLAVEITDSSGAPATPTTIVCTITRPDGTSVTPTPVGVGTGSYTVDYQPTQAGVHVVRWASTGPVASFADVFDVRPAGPGGVVSLADAKAYLNVRVDTYDDELRGMLFSAVERVERHLHQALGRRTVTELVTANRRGIAELSTVPILSVTSVESSDGLLVWSVPDLAMDPDTGRLWSVAGIRLAGDLLAVYQAGSTAVTATQRDAVLMVLEEYWRTQRTRLGGRGNSMGGGATQFSVETGPAGEAPLGRRLTDLLGASPPLVA